jgi:hypothetical protein
VALTVTITDAANGGGFTAAVAGSGGAAVSLFALFCAADPLGNNWQAAGSRTGDGTISGSLRPGLYFFYAATPTAVSLVAQALLTRGQDALHDCILDAAAARAALLDLPGVAMIDVRDKPVADGLEYGPYALILTPYGKAEQELGGTNQRDDTGFPVYAILVGYSSVVKEDPQQRWRKRCRELLRRAFRSQLLPGVDEVMDCTYTPDPVVTFDGAANQYLVSAQLFSFVCREPRGLGA